MFGETTISYVKIGNHPIETTIYKWLFGVPGTNQTNLWFAGVSRWVLKRESGTIFPTSSSFNLKCLWRHFFDVGKNPNFEICFWATPLKTNISPENSWLEDDISFRMVPFQGTNSFMFWGPLHILETPWDILAAQSHNVWNPKTWKLLFFMCARV